MKRIYLAYTLIALSFARQVTCADSSYIRVVSEALIAGAASGVSIDFLRDNVLPNLDSYNIYKKHGICRDQVTGQVKVVSALLGLSATVIAMRDQDPLSFLQLLTRTSCIVLGINLSAWSKKMIQGLGLSKQPSASSPASSASSGSASSTSTPTGSASV